MKYILRKDLPFARYGKEVSLLYTGSKTVVECYLNASDGVTFKIGGDEMLELLIENGWIEKVKPREWYQVETRSIGGYINSTFLNKHYTTYGEVYELVRDNPEYRIVKVREIIE